MTDGTKHSLSSADDHPGAPESGRPALKTWVTPKVIVATLASEETESNVNGGGDGGGHS
jgi:hypothetical protein